MTTTASPCPSPPLGYGAYLPWLTRAQIQEYERDHAIIPGQVCHQGTGFAAILMLQAWRHPTTPQTQSIRRPRL